MTDPLFSFGSVAENTVDIPDDVKVMDVITFKPEEQLGKFFERPLQVYTTTVTGGTVAAIPALTSVFSLWKVLPTVAQKLKGYKFFRGNLKITVTYAGSPQALGTFGLAFHPIAGPNDADGGSTNEIPWWFGTDGASFVATKLSLPHILCPLEQTLTRTLLLPHPAATPFMEILTGDDYAFSPLNLNTYSNMAGTAVQPITIRMFASYEDVELFTPMIPQSGYDETKPTLSTALGYGSSVLEAVGRVFPIVTPWAHMVGAGARFARSLGFSRPPVIAFPSYFSFVGTNLSFMSGAPDQSVRLALDPASAVDVSGACVPMSSTDDGDLMKILTKPGLVLMDVAVPSVASYMLVLPNLAMGGTNVAYGGAYFERIPLNLSQFLFRSYSGGIDVYVEFIANSFLKANVMLWVIPSGSLLPTSVTDSPYLRRTLVSVVGRTVVKVHIPYSRQNPMQAHIYPSIATLTTGGTGTSVHDQIGFMLIDPIVVGSTFVPTLKMNVYLAAGDDFCVANPSLDTVKALKMTMLSTKLYPESGHREAAEGVQDVPTEGRKVKMRALPFILQGEQVVDVHELFKRTVFQAEFQAPPTSDVVCLSYAGPVPNGSFTYGSTGGYNTTAINVKNVNWTYLTLLSACFYGITGGVRYKFITGGSTTPNYGFCTRGGAGERPIPLSSAPYTTGFPDLSGGGALVPGSNMLVEFEYPSRTIFSFREAWRNGSSTTQHASSNQPVCAAICPIAFNAPLYLLQSGADDTRLHKFLYVPPVSPMAVALLLGREETVDLLPVLEDEEYSPIALSRQ